MTKIRKLYILIATFAILISISYVGTNGSYTYKSLEDCILIRSANNSSALMLAKVQCEKEIKFEYEKMKTRFTYRFKDAEDEGYNIYEIYEHLVNMSSPFLSVDSFQKGITKIISKDTDSILANVIRGALLGALFWGLIGFLIDYFKRKKSNA